MRQLLYSLLDYGSTATTYESMTNLSTACSQVVLCIPCRSIPLADRLTMLPLLYSILDYDRTSATYEQYDKMSAWELFQR